MTPPELDAAPHDGPRFTLNPTPLPFGYDPVADGYPAAEEAIAQLKRNRDRRTPALADWIRHPDERVALALLSCTRYNRSIWNYLSVLRDRALADARRMGMLWTPLINAVALRFSPWFDLPIDLDRNLRLLVADLEMNGTADDVRALLTFASPHLLHAIAAGAPHIPIDSVWHLTRQGGYVQALASNPHLTPDAGAALVNYIIDVRILGRWSAQHLKRQSVGEYVRMLDGLRERGFAIPANRVSRLAERLRGLRRFLPDDENYRTLQRIVYASLRDSMEEMTPRQRDAIVQLLLNGDGEIRMQTIAAL